MPMMTKPAFGPRVAIAYVTIGILVDIWVAVWYVFFTRYEPQVDRLEMFLLSGLFLTGLTFALIGFFLGQIGRQARKVELPPEEVEREEALIEQMEAAAPHPVVPVADPVRPMNAAPPAEPSSPAPPVAHAPGSPKL